MKFIKDIFRRSLLLKITSLNASVITARLLVSLFVQRILAITVGEIGIAKIGQLRNLVQIITSTSSLGIFNGVVKYTAEYKEQTRELKKVLNTSIFFVLIGSVITSIFLFFCAQWISVKLFSDSNYSYLIRVLALLTIVVGVNRLFHGIINGLSEYKKYAKIDFFNYILSTVLLLIFLYNWELKGVLLAIALAPLVQLLVMLYVFGTTLKKVLKLKNIVFKLPYAKEVLAFTFMSLISTGLLNYIEIDIRTMVTNRININEAGYWTAMNFISKNYMAFSSGIFTLYVIPKFSRIYEKKPFFKEVFNIYKTILPIFGLGMLIVYLLRNQIINIVYPNFLGLEPLFKWQLLGDFIRLIALVVAHQFLAKRMVKSFIFSELLSLLLFYVFAYYLTYYYGVEGVVIGHLIRSVIMLFVIYFFIIRYFNKQTKFIESKNQGDG